MNKETVRREKLPLFGLLVSIVAYEIKNLNNCTTFNAPILKEFSDISFKKGISEEAGILLMNYDYPGLEEVKKSHVLKAYEQTGRIKTQTAKFLSIGLNTLRRKLEAYGVA